MKTKIEEINLWNVAKNKTRLVLEYINLLEESDKWKESAVKHFRKCISEARNSTTANEALKIIGYNYGKQCDLINKCFNMS